MPSGRPATAGRALRTLLGQKTTIRRRQLIELIGIDQWASGLAIHRLVRLDTTHTLCAEDTSAHKKKRAGAAPRLSSISRSLARPG